MTYIYILTLIPPIHPSTPIGDGGGRVPDEDEEGRQGREERGREPHGALLGCVGCVDTYEWVDAVSVQFQSVIATTAR